MDNEDTRRPALRKDAAGADSAPAKETWEKPEIVSFLPLSAARAVSYRIGDGISNLS